MRYIAKISAAFLANIVLVSIVVSQSTLRLPFAKKISIENGLSSYNVKKIIQDKYGFIWIATQDGLNRYDGRNFIVYNKAMGPDHRLIGSDVWDVEEDKANGMLWVATSNGGINSIELITGKVDVTIQAKIFGGSSNIWLRCIKLYKDQLWMGTSDGLYIYNIKSGKFEQFDSIPFRHDKEFSIEEIVIDQHKNFWLFINNYGTVIYSAEKRTIINSYPLSALLLKKRDNLKQFNAATFLPDSSLLVGTNQGFRKIIYSKSGIKVERTGIFNSDAAFTESDIEALSIDASHCIWFSTSSKLYKVDIINGVVHEVKDASLSVSNDWLNYIFEIFFDKSGNIWLGTRRGIAYTRNTTPAFTPYSLSDDQGLKIDHAFYVYAQNDSILYVCTETSLLKVNVIQNRIIPIDKGKLYYFITEHIDKNMLVSTDQRFFVYRPQDTKFYDITQFYSALSLIKDMSVNTVTYVNDSLAVIGTEKNGFYIWNFKSNLLDTSKHAITNTVNACYKDKKGMIWVLGDHSITTYEPGSGKTKTISFDNPITKNYYDVLFDICEAKGDYWIAAYGTGLLQIDDKLRIKKVFSIEDGLSNAGVYKIFPLNDSLIFLTTNNGLSILNVNNGRFSNFYKQDGLHSNAFEENCGIYKNGKFYAGGVDGFTIIDPGNLSTNNVAPKLYLNSIQVKTNSAQTDTSSLCLSSLQIPDSVLQVTVYFSALNYLNPSRTTFSYRIKNLDTGWINLGTQNFVNFIGLKPGQYNLEVKAANEDNIRSEPLALSLIYQPKWYQTWWFKLLIILSIATAIYALYRYRISQLKQQQQIRTNIASDLHDDIGSTLNTVKVFTHMARREPQKEEHLNQVERLLTEAVAALKDIIWVLDDSQDTMDQFTERIKKFTLPLTLAKDIHFECVVEVAAKDLILSKMEKKNFWMIAKETINNSIKYAECRNIHVLIQRIDHRVALTIKDDGKGFDMDAISHGHGLKNIVSRAKQIHYNGEIISSRGNGTAVRVARW